jgi:hypothetical protein
VIDGTSVKLLNIASIFWLSNRKQYKKINKPLNHISARPQLMAMSLPHNQKVPPRVQQLKYPVVLFLVIGFFTLWRYP